MWSNVSISKIKYTNFVSDKNGPKDKCCSKNTCYYQRLKKYITITMGEQTLISPAS
jgi:hypothetical protein